MMRVYTPFSEEQKRTYAELRRRLHVLRWSQSPDVLRKITEKKEALCAKYPDARCYGLFSLFSGRDFQQTTGPFDFPGGDSIERFINRHYAGIDFKAKPVSRKRTVVLGKGPKEPRSGKSKFPEPPLCLELPIMGAFKKGETLLQPSRLRKACDRELESSSVAPQPREGWWQSLLRRCGVSKGQSKPKCNGTRLDCRLVQRNKKRYPRLQKA